jgi:Carboxypeptidase regulatory-like domain
VKKVFALSIVLLWVIPSPTYAQVNAVLSGTAADASGALIPGVEVTAKNINTGITDTRLTNEAGNFVFPSLQPGTYTLSAALSGFQTATYNNVVLGQGQQVRLNFTLQVAAAAQNVEVTIAADTVLATTSASVGNVLADHDVQTLPLNSRNVLDMLATTAGVIYTTNAFGAQVANFGGAAIGSINTTRDGLTTNDGRYNSSNGAYSAIFTSPDMIEEVRVSSNSVDPSLGRGAAQVQMRTRAGTNEFHGAAFYTNNNSFLNSQTFFQNQQGFAKNYANRNQFGGRLGGPIIKNKAFFFILTDDQRYLDKTTVDALVLTPQARAGVFRYSTDHRNGAANSTTPSVDAAGNLKNPSAVRSFNLFSDVKDPNRTGIDQTWVQTQYLARMPLPNNYQVGDGLNTAGFQWLRPENGLDGATGQSPNTNRNHFTGRFDYQVNTNNKLTFTMTREKNWGVTGQTGEPDVPLGGFGDIYRTPYFYTVQYTATISPTILNEFRWGRKQDTWLGTSPVDKGCCLFGASESTRTAAAQALYNSFPNVGSSFLYISNGAVPGAPISSVFNGLPIALANYAPVGVASPRTTVSPFTQWADTLSFTKGAHSFSVGGEFVFTSSQAANTGGSQTTRPFATLGINPSFPVSGITTAAFPGLQAPDVITAQNLLANLAGSISNIQEQFYINSPTQNGWSDYTQTIFFKRAQHENDWDLFFKDNWKASTNLTLLLGLRYDKYGVPYDQYGLAGRYVSSFGAGQAGLFGCSGAGFNVMWTPGAGNCGSASPSLTATEFVGKDSPSPNKLVHRNDWKDFAPSFGFSWNLPYFQRSTVIRGGYGINYAGAPDFLAYNTALGSFPGNSLNVTQTTFPGGYLDIARAAANQSLYPLSTAGSQPFQPLPLNGVGSRTGTIYGWADNYKTPYLQSFNLSIQRELTRDLTFDIGWVGNKGSRLDLLHQLNDVNVRENGILDAFNAVRAGQNNVPLMDQIFNGVNFAGVGVVGQGGLTAAQALRRSTTTNGFIANGNVGGFANFINTNATLAPGANAGKPGGLLLNAGLPQNFIVVSPQFGNVQLHDNSNNSSYHSLQAHVVKRTSYGVTGQFSYTFSKALGIGRTPADAATTRDPRNLHLDKALQSIDRTNVIASNATYDLPFGSNHLFFANAPGWAQRVIGGWQIASIASWQSGAPLQFALPAGSTANAAGSLGTLYNLATNTFDQVAPIPKGDVVKGTGFVSYFGNLKTQAAPQPNFGGDASLPGVFTNQVITDASGNIILKNPDPGRTGNMSYNSSTIKGPGMLSFNAAITKSVRISETKTFTLRADAVNVLNKPQWGAPSLNINNANFGRITSVIGNVQRLVTINARIDF